MFVVPEASGLWAFVVMVWLYQATPFVSLTAPAVVRCMRCASVVARRSLCDARGFLRCQPVVRRSLKSVVVGPIL